MRALRAFLAGVGAAYFFDPRLGKQRRAGVRDKALKTVRALTHTVGKKTRLAAGKLRGVYAHGRRFVTRPEASVEDSVVEQRIRSEAFRDLDVPAGDFDVEVEDGIATLRGPALDEELASQVVARVSKVAGVENVELSTTEEHR